MTEQSLFLAAIELETPADRVAYLQETCGEDTELRAAVEALLDAHERGSNILDGPPVGSLSLAVTAKNQPAVEGQAP
jgi:hypothetical protein